ncbi:hypothetical protein [Caballeronia sp. LZ032]|uniref:hypothetical protein n=1 Tax=Caballeronia sp. LZ032 TaxID=3038565 RepID=UPI00285679C9|nr:hypothetical protein [Caballeronia sp. LZ032]MDR5881143.1 hypothetical protein [Caballeronia sp. LZ032]
MNYDNIVEASVLARQQAFEAKMQKYDLFILSGVGIAILGLPAALFLVWLVTE